MSVLNKEITDKLTQVAELLDIKGENEFRIRAYRNAVRTLSGISGSLSEMVKKGEDLSSIPGIGGSMAKKITEIAETGELKQLKKLKNKIPSSLIEIMKLEQMGPQRTKILYDKLNIDSIDDLKKAAQEGKLEQVKGFGETTANNILKEIEEYSRKGGSKRIKLYEAEEQINPMVEYLKRKMDNVTIAGSYRRKKETVGDIDILAVSKNPKKAMNDFTGYENTGRVLSSGKTKASIKLRTGLQVDLRLVEKDAFGAALLYFTGSKEHSIALRKMGQEKNLKVNEYGIFKGEKRLAAKTEKDMYKALGELFYKKYLEFSELNEGPGISELFHYDKSYRANIRAKVTLISAKKQKGKKNIKELNDAKMYIRLMENYMNLKLNKY